MPDDDNDFDQEREAAKARVEKWLDDPKHQRQHGPDDESTRDDDHKDPKHNEEDDK
jgi:hypothetical protein